jgi:hypothetical protein
MQRISGATRRRREHRAHLKSSTHIPPPPKKKTLKAHTSTHASRIDGMAFD